MNEKRTAIKNDRLQVEIMLPGVEYRGSRYDWSGIVSQITLDGVHTFCPKTSVEPMGGLGLSGIIEFKDTAAYDETEIADRFPLMGVGLLKKPDTAPFCFFKPYDVLPFQQEYHISDTAACFKTYPLLCRGYAMLQQKTLTISGNSLLLTNRMENVGEKFLRLHEFNHNFFCFDGREVDESYVLTLPYQMAVTVRRGLVISGFNTVSVRAMDESSASAAFLIRGYEGLSGHYMRLENRLTGTSVFIEEDFNAVRFYNYANAGAICPETFCSIDLEPGEIFSFGRKYTFEDVCAKYGTNL